RRDHAAHASRRRQRIVDRRSHRRRSRYSKRRPNEDLRAILYDEAPEPGDRSWAVHLLRDRHGARWTHRGRQRRWRRQRVSHPHARERRMSEPTAGSRIRILVAEDEENLAQILCTFLRGRGHYVVCVGDGNAALQAVRDEAFDVALVDIVMPEMDGLETLKHLRAEPDPPQVIIITGNGTVETAINAMKLGAYDYMAKPYRMAEIDVLVRRAWEKHQLARENRYLQARLNRVDANPEVVTQYAPMHAVLALLGRVASTDSPVLITGESGTGKTLLARALHRLSGRVGPMVEADSTVVAEGVLDVELFGHERGAFTGAVARKAGLIELAANGTLFIDEVGLLSSKLQSKLARALEHGSFFRIGGTQKVEIAVRLVTSTNHDLDAAVKDGRVRDDLLYRLNTVTVSLPPLRDRAVDIPLLAQHFLTQFAGA